MYTTSILERHTSTADESLFHRWEWPAFVAKEADRWQQFHLRALNSEKFKQPHNLLFVLYEDLKDKTEYELRRILTFLEQKIDEDVLKCAVSDEIRDGLFKRNPKNQSDRFTRKMLVNLDRKWRRLKMRIN